jgi:serine/threonine protein kinase
MDSQRLGNDRYVVRGVLGEGAQGVTFDALDATSNRSVAIKRFDVRGAKSWKDVELAERETRVLATLDHPLVPRYLEHFEEGGHLYLVMDKVDGDTLDAIRKREGALPEDEVRRFLACADRALTYLHGRSSPVVHRDVKPRNVIRRPDGSYVLVDFGAVSELLQRKGSSTIVGTMGYMAPEQFQGRALPVTDVYAVGATAIAALTGAEPETLPHRGLRIDVRAALRGRTSEAMIASLESMLEPDPDLRAASIGAALDNVRSSATPSVSPPIAAPMQRGKRGKRGRRERVPESVEDANVHSIRKLLWLLWGLGWVIVPLMMRHLNAPKSLIPTIMFVSLAALFIVTWHKGALIRAALRALTKDGDAASEPGVLEAPRGASSARRRVEVGNDQVRVHTSDLPPDEVGATDVEVREPIAQRAPRP